MMIFGFRDNIGAYRVSLGLMIGMVYPHFFLFGAGSANADPAPILFPWITLIPDAE
jgi:hypothetical protein